MENIWISENRTYGNSDIKLTDTYSSVVLTSGKLRTELLEHQKRTVQAMIDLERKRFVKLSPSPWHESRIYFRDMILETNGAILSEKPGSGKTFEILALIAESMLGRIAESTYIPHIHKPELIKRPDAVYKRLRFAPEIRRTYQRVHKQTLIFVGKSVIEQWSRCIEKYTTFRVFTIRDVRDLWDFYYMMFHPDETSTRVSDYEIVLIKNGTVSGKFDPPELDGTSLSKVKCKAIMSIFSELFRHTAWSRIVFDDFDTLQIPVSATVIPALFTWFVSATKKRALSMCSKDPETAQLADVITGFRPYYVSLWNNRDIFTHFNIASTDDFIDRSVQASIIKYYTYQFQNRDDRFIRAIGNMSQNNGLIEMLNSDAIATASKTVGAKGTSISDIFERLLDNNWIEYKKTIQIERYIPVAREAVGELLSNPVISRKVDKDTIQTFQKNIRRPGPIDEIRNLRECNEKMTSYLNDVQERNAIRKAESGKAIDRVKNNLMHGECPITCEPLRDSSGIVVLKCCGVTISKEGSAMISKHYSGFTCPNCRAPVTGETLILIDRDLDMQSTIDRVIHDDVLDEEPEVQEPEDSEDESEIPELPASDAFYQKMQCIIDIIQGKTAELDKLRQEKDTVIPGLLNGATDLGDVKTIQKKILIYSSFGESTKKISGQLTRQGIKFTRLIGSVKQIDDIQNRYWLDPLDPEAINVLLINGPKYCAGLDLQNTSDLIFTHRILDKNIETQIAGRGARYGRKNNFHVHYVLYKYEYQLMWG